MLDRLKLTRTARARIKDGEALLRSRRYDGAVYLCGYAVEMALKVRMCRTLGWAEFPDTAKEYQSLKTHSLDVLLHLSGMEKKIKRSFLAEWSAVATWEPGARYKPVGSATRSDAEQMIEASRKLVEALCSKR